MADVISGGAWPRPLFDSVWQVSSGYKLGIAVFFSLSTLVIPIWYCSKLSNSLSKKWALHTAEQCVGPSHLLLVRRTKRRHWALSAFDTGNSCKQMPFLGKFEHPNTTHLLPIVLENLEVDDNCYLWENFVLKLCSIWHVNNTCSKAVCSVTSHLRWPSFWLAD